MIYSLTEDYQLQLGDLHYSSYHTWLPQFEVVKVTDRAVLIAIPNKIFKNPALKGETSFDTVDIWLPKKCLTLSAYNTKTKKGCGWAWDKVFQPNLDQAIEEIKDRKKKKELKRQANKKEQSE